MSLQDDALRDFWRLAREEGIDTTRTSTCYPPGCQLHRHADDEKRRFVRFAARLDSSTRRSIKPKREDKEQTS